MNASAVLITEPLGARWCGRYLVSQVRGTTLRLYRCDSHWQAEAVRDAWRAGNHAWAPGTVRELAPEHMQEATA